MTNTKSNPNIDFCGIRNLLLLLKENGFSEAEIRKLAVYIAAKIGADIVFFRVVIL